MGVEDDFAQAVEVITGLYYFVTVKRPDSPRYSSIAQSNICYCIDDELLYEPFFADFGPLNLGRTYRFCQKTKQLLQEAEKLGKRVYLYTGPHAHQKANAAVLVGIYQVIYLNRTADAAFKSLSAYKPYVPFRDASCGVSTFHLTVYDVVKGIQRARDVGFIDWNSGSSTWSLEEYEYYEQVENGDLNWIVPGKFVAFSGPAARSNEVAGYRLHTPEDYWDYFRRRGVTTIVRLNKKVYDRKRFLDGGFKHHEMYFPDGSCPTDAIIQRFLETVEAEPGAVAVHCKAGLGRTGVLICLYIMKHYRFSAEEVIGYIRVCRPGSVIGPQQNFIREMESRMWHEGELYRAARGLPKVAPPVSDLLVAGRAAGQTADAGASASPPAAVGGANGYLNGSAYGQRTVSGSGFSNGGRAGSAGNSSVSGGVGGGGANGGGSLLASAAGAAAVAAAAAAAVATSASDMSLLQYSKLQSYGSGAASLPYGSGAAGASSYYASAASGDYGSSAVAMAAALGSSGGGGGGTPANGYVPTASIAASYSTSSVPTVSSFRSRYGNSNAGYNGATSTSAIGSGVGRSMTPLRYSQQANGAYGGAGHYGGYHHAGVGVSSSLQGPLQASAAVGPSRGSLNMSAVTRSMPVAPGGIGGVAAPGVAGSGGGGGMGRSPSTGRLSAAAGLATPPSSGASGLRSTLHTDTLSAADRPKLIPERNTQSADIGASYGLGATSPGGGGAGSQPWRISVPSSGVGSSGPGTPTSSSAAGINRAPSLGHASRSGSATGHPGAPPAPGSTSGGVARILAPNGQPRKVPVALLNQYSQQAAAQSWSASGGGKQAAGGGAAQLRSGYSYGMRQ